MGVTWHWTATWTLEECRRLLGGPSPARQGVASAHYAVGRSVDEGIDRYVELDNRSWHAGREQQLRWDGRPMDDAKEKGAHSTIGVETVHIGYARKGVGPASGWIPAATPEGRPRLIQPWSEEQVEMMVAVGREIQRRWPHLCPQDHHGHHDLCPTYKEDPIGFPFARVLRAIYDQPELPDVWTPHWTVRGRQEALWARGFAPEEATPGRWSEGWAAALRRFQRSEGLTENGLWTVWVSRRLTGR